MARSGAPRAALSGPIPGRPPWLAITLFSALATALLCWPSWPGCMSYDSLLAYQQARYGVQTALWPPLHTYLFVLSRAIGADTWDLLLAQTFLLLFGATLTPRRARAWMLSAFFVGGLIRFPTLLGPLMAHWRDVPTGSFAILGFGLWLAGVRYRSILLVLAAALSIGVSVGLRYNAFVLAAPALALMVWRPFLERGAPRWAQALTGLAIVLSLGGAWASTQWRLPHLLKMPDPQNIAGTQLFDVIGTSACAGRNYLPAQVTRGRSLNAWHLRTAYDPRHLLITLQRKPGVPEIVESDGGGRVGKVWRGLFLREPGCYLEHRANVFAEQMGMEKDHVFYPVHGAIDANPYGLKLAHPAASAWTTGYVERNAPEMWRRPFLLYGLAAGLGLTAMARALAWLILAMLAGAFAYPALPFVAAPAADARYIFPSNVLCLLIAVASLGLLIDPGGRPAR